VQLCSMCHAKEADVLWSCALPGLRGIMWSRDLSPSTQGTHHPYSSQAIGDSVYLQHSRGMDLDSAHLVDSQAAQSGICGYRAVVYVHIVISFSSSNTVSFCTKRLITKCLCHTTKNVIQRQKSQKVKVLKR
jgi:hypothetical protein